MKKRVLSFLLTVLVLWGMLPLSSLEVQAYHHSASTPLPAGAYKNWKQTDPRWTDVTIGIYPWYDRNNNYHYYNTVGHAGCYITSLAILCNAYGLKFKDGSEITPGTFGERLYDNGSCTYLTSDGSMYNSNTWCGTMIPGIEYYTTRWITSESRSQIASLIAGYLNDPNAEYGVVAGVYEHFVAVDYVSGSSVYICDPGWTGRTELFSSYSRVYRLVVFKFSEKGGSDTTPSYTVTYDANGGTQTPASQTKKKGETISLRLETPTRAGYTFAGWATSKNGKVVYSAGQSYSADANITLYAVWKERTDCEVWRVNPSVSLNIRGGPSTSNAIITALPAGSDVAVTEIRIADGHVWAKVDEGWCALEYCTYVRGSLYRITYDSNGGKGAPASQASAYNQTVQLSSTVPTRENYEFLGWSTSANATTPSIKAGANYTNTTATSVKLYAVWQKVGSTVSYHANGGKDAPASQHKPFGETAKITSKQPTRTGYDFMGWSTTPSGDVEYRAGDVYRDDENLTLYAVWKVQVYEVTFDPNGGSAAPESMEKTFGDAITLPNRLLIREDYLFLGWATKADAEQAEYRAGETYRKEGNTTLYAVWKPYTYLITFDANGGKNAPASAWKIKGTDLVIPDKKPQLTGYVFLGWAYSPDAAVPDLRMGGALQQDAELTLYAVWGQDCYVLSFDANGGEGEPADQIKEQDTVLTLSEKIPTRTGYTFLGWASSPEATQEEYLPGGTYDLEGENTLYAVWRINSYYITVQYVYEDGFTAAQTYVEKVEYQSKYTVPSPLLDMATASERVIEGTMGDGNLDFVVTYYWAPRENRMAIVTGIGDVNEHTLSVTDVYYTGNGTLYYGVSRTESKDGVIQWQTSPVFENLENETDYYVFVWVYGSAEYENVCSDAVLIHTTAELRQPDSNEDPNPNEWDTVISETPIDFGDMTKEEALLFFLPITFIGMGLTIVLLSLILLRRLRR